MTVVTLTREDGTEIEADAVLTDPSDANQLTRGREVTLVVESGLDRLIVPDDTTETIPSGTTRTVGETVIKSGGTLVIDGTLETVSVDNDGTLDNNGTLIIADGPRSVLELFTLEERAGNFATRERRDSTVTFREFVPDSDSLLLEVTPSNTLQQQSVPGIWGLVTDVSDARRPAVTSVRVSVTLTVLARLGEFGTHTDVRDALEV